MKRKYFKISGQVEINNYFEEPNLAKAKIKGLISSNSQKIRYIREKSILDKLTELYFKNYSEVSEICDSSEAKHPVLEPIEPAGKYAIPNLESFSRDMPLNKVRTYLDRYSISSYDSSWHFGGAHFYLDYLIYNTGYFYYNYYSGSGGSGSYPALFIGRVEEIDPEIEGKKHEIEAGEKLIRYLEGEKKLVFLDESLNFIYTFKWSKDKKRNYIGLLKKFLYKVVDMDVVPLGIFYTRAYDIVRSLEYIDRSLSLPSIQDKQLFNSILEVGERSQLFKVINPVIRDFKIEIAAFYLKLGRGNVIRIEFPYDSTIVKKHIDDIQISVFLQSLLGGGYPYSLVRAHEMAVISYEDRREIEDIISYILNIPSEYLYSKKQLSKWRSIS